MKKFTLAAAMVALGCTSASAADLAYTKAPVVAPVYSWTGCYVGATVGYRWGTSSVTAASGFGAGLPITNDLNRMDGFTGGGTLGCNYQTGAWVVGLEGDFSGGQAKDSQGVLPPFNTTFIVSERQDWVATVRGRVGYAVNNWLFYGTGGLALTELKQTLLFTPSGATNSQSQVLSGWTAGAGVEWGFASNWTAKVEYLYTEYSRQNYFGPTAPLAGLWIDADLKQHIVRGGVNYRF